MNTAIIVLKNIKTKNYVSVFKTDKDKNCNEYGSYSIFSGVSTKENTIFLIKIYQKNNTEFDNVYADYILLRDTIYYLVQIHKTHTYYYAEPQFLLTIMCSSNKKFDDDLMNIITN
jgi:hypothetical protein